MPRTDLRNTPARFLVAGEGPFSSPTSSSRGGRRPPFSRSAMAQLLKPATKLDTSGGRPSRWLLVPSGFCHQSIGVPFSPTDWAMAMLFASRLAASGSGVLLTLPDCQALTI